MSREVHHWRIGSTVEVFDIRSAAEPGTLHCHATFNIGAVIEGHACLDIDGTTYDQPTGAVVLLNPFEPHASSWLSTSNRYFVINISQDAWPILTSSVKGLPRQCRLNGPIAYDPRMFDALLALRDKLIGRPAGVEAEDIKALLNVCADRNLIGSAEAEAPGAAVESLRDHFIRESLEADDAFNSVRIQQIATELEMSRYKFSRMCRQNSGMQPRRLRIQLMVASAQVEISRGASLSDAALKARFSDQSHMTREFRRTIGMTPREFQKVIAHIR